MQYLGGKTRLSRYIAPIIDTFLLTTEGRYVEPFVGGCNILPRLQNVQNARCYDAHRGVITLWQHVQSGWQPPTELSEEVYRELRRVNDKRIPDTAFAAFGCSFGGKEWGGYARKTGKRAFENQALRTRNRLLQQATSLQSVVFRKRCFFRVQPKKPSVIYCDPPYENTTKYRTPDFDTERFHARCENLAAQGHIVLVSGFTAPGFWPTLWEKKRPIKVSGVTKHRTEKLFLAANWLPF